MKKCAVIGSSGFIGYELVCQLMEYNEVTAVVMEKGNESDVISEEKIFSIGRNAKVVFVDEDQFLSEEAEYDTIFICHYFDELKLKGTVNLSESIVSTLDNITSKSKEIIFLLSTQKELAVIERIVIEQMKNKNCNLTFIEIPSLYGPWEPSSGLVHELIVLELDKKNISIKNVYGSNEILFVEDVGRAIRIISEKELKEHKYVITAKQSMHLKEQDQFTGIQQMMDGIKFTQMRNYIDATPFVIINTTSIEAGIQKQKQQIQQYFHLY
jgi:nucleoside-diphosphate-sugar epimerase